jgi:orotate phosphoribosyltransferase-like protein
MIADELDISKDTVKKLFIEDLKKRKRKVCVLFVPCTSTAEQKEE